MKKLFLISAVTAGLFTSCVQNDLIAPELGEAEKETKFRTPKDFDLSQAELVLQNYENPTPDTMKPYEVRVYLWNK